MGRTSVPRDRGKHEGGEPRASRGLELWRRGAVGYHAGRWFVAGERGGLYEVGLDPDSCTCPDYRRHKEPCKHIYAAEVARAKSGVCSGCGGRFPNRELVELEEGNHDDLTHFDGDRLCGECADGAGVER